MCGKRGGEKNRRLVGKLKKNVFDAKNEIKKEKNKEKQKYEG